eukprot:239491-Chlamydomonas_euryale.AAC.1
MTQRSPPTTCAVTVGQCGPTRQTIERGSGLSERVPVTSSTHSRWSCRHPMWYTQPLASGPMPRHMPAACSRRNSSRYSSLSRAVKGMCVWGAHTIGGSAGSGTHSAAVQAVVHMWQHHAGRHTCSRGT